MSNHFFESTLGLLGLVLTLLHSLINMASREILLKHKSDHVTEISSMASSQKKQSPQSASRALEMWTSVACLTVSFSSPLCLLCFPHTDILSAPWVLQPTLASLTFHLTVPSTCTIHFPDRLLAPS